MGFFKKVFNKPATPSLSIASGPKTEAKTAKQPVETAPEEEIIIEESLPAGGAVLPVLETPAPPPVVPVEPPLPLLDEREALRKAWREVLEMRNQAVEGFEKINLLDEHLREKDRKLVEQINHTQTVMDDVFDLLAGKDREKTLDEINDLLASRFDLGGKEETANAADSSTMLELLQDKTESVREELKGFLKKSRQTLVQVNALKQQKDARLSVLEKQLEDATHTLEKGEDVRRRFLAEKKSLEGQIDSAIASRRNLETQISLLEEKLQQTMEEKTTLEEQSREVEVEKDELVARKDAVRKELEETEGILENLRGTLKSLEDEKEGIEQQLKNFLKEKENAADDIRLAEKSRDDQVKVIARLEDEIAQSQKQSEALKAEIEEVVQSRRLLEQKKHSQDASAEADGHQLEDLETSLAVLVEEKNDYEEKLERERAALLEAERELSSRKESLAEKGENLQYIESEIKNQQAEVGRLKSQLQETREKKTRIDQDLAILAQQAEKQPAAAGLDDDLALIRMEKEELLETLHQVEEELKNNQAQNRALEDKIGLARQSREDVEEQLQIARAEVNRLQEQLEQAKESLLASAEGQEKAETAVRAEQDLVDRKMGELSAVLDKQSSLEDELARTRQEQEVKVSPAVITSQDTVYEVLEEGTIAASMPAEKIEELPPAHKKAQRLARVIVSDIILYNKEILKTAANQRNFYEILEQPIKRSDDYFREKVTREIYQDRDYLKEELEKLRLSLKP